MDPIEQAIRNAFSKGSPGDRAFREKVYRSAFAALDRTLQANPGITVEKAIARRKALQARITAIETEFIPPPVSAAPAVSPDDARSKGAKRLQQGGSRRIEPSTGDDALADAAGRLGVPPRLVGDHSEVQPDPDARRARRPRRGWAVLFLVATLLALIGIGAWWAVQTGLLLSPAERDTSVPNPPVTLPNEDFAPEGTAQGESSAPPPLGSEPAVQRNWINIFSAADPSAVTAPSGASADVIEVDGEPFLRVRSGDPETAVMFDVGQGVLQQLAGKSAVFNIVAKAEGEERETQFSVDCNFGEFGDCGRKRFVAGPTKGEFLFEVEFPDSDPGAGGTIALSSDVSSSGRAVEIFEIKVAPTE